MGVSVHLVINFNLQQQVGMNKSSVNSVETALFIKGEAKIAVVFE